MKLKEQREHLKAQGNKHEDNIMKENAKLQVRIFSVSIKQRSLTLYIAERSQVSDCLYERVHGEDRQGPGRGRSGFCRAEGEGERESLAGTGETEGGDGTEEGLQQGQRGGEGAEENAELHELPPISSQGAPS